MAAPEPALEPAAGDKDYAVQLTIDEMLLEAAEQIEKARHAPSKVALGWRLKMASRALRCALEVYGDWFTVPEGKKNEEHV